LTNNGAGIIINFSLGLTGSFLGTSGAWAGSDFRSATGSTSVIATAGATWYITGVQLEAGSVATPFERRPFGQELQLCQRYLPTITANGNNNTYAGGGFYRNNTTQVILYYNFPIQARVPPSGLVLGSGVGFTVINPAVVNAFGVTSAALGDTGVTFASITGTVSSGSANSSLTWLINGGVNGNNAYFTGCEL
jgi:hypothetical protein